MTIYTTKELLAIYEAKRMRQKQEPKLSQAKVAAASR